MNKNHNLMNTTNIILLIKNLMLGSHVKKQTPVSNFVNQSFGNINFLNSKGISLLFYYWTFILNTNLAGLHNKQKQCS